jgi:sarcosine oxidase/L-pipecolate oxidase
MSVGDMLPQFELDTIQAMEACGHKDTQLITTNAQHVAIADGRGQGYAMDPFYLHKRGKNNIGVLDSTGGLVAADKACLFALHKARGYGAKFILDPVAGAFTSLATSAEGKTIGIKTADGNTHEAAVTIMACGGWTPSLLPRLDYLCEATAGSVVMYKIPRSSKLWDRFDPERFPSWLWKVRDGANGGVYGFPRDDQGYLKIGYRGIKYTNPQIQSDGKERSTPVTRWTKDQQLTQIPDQAMNVINGFVDEYIPELREEGIDIELTRVCWYTDTFDNHFVIDYDPDDEGLFVATGGSGHAFKYLPNIGDHVVDILERKVKHRMTTHAWRWRARGDKPPLNVLMQGSKDARALENVKLARVDGVRAKL